MPVPVIADSSTIEEYSQIAGAGPYILLGATDGHFRFADGFANGVTIEYRVTNGPQTEIVSGILNTATNTLTRAAVLWSSNGNAAVVWSGTTRLFLRPALSSLPLCATPPTAGQVLAWDAVHNQWCPETIPTPVPDLTIRRVTTGLSDTLTTLTTTETAILWSSAAAGNKTQSIPDPTLYDSHKLFIKLRPSVTGSLTITSAGTSATIEGQASLTLYAPDDGTLISDGTANNWDLV